MLSFSQFNQHTTMKSTFIYFSCLIFVFTSCNNAKFNRYPGTKIDSVPEQFRGVFRDPDAKGKKKNEVVIIAKNYWKEGAKDTKYFLNDSNIISVYKGVYFYNILNDNTFWSVFYIKPSGKNFNLYSLDYDPKEPSDKNSILKYFTPQLDKDSNYVFTMDEEKLLQYAQKELLKEKPMKFKRK